MASKLTELREAKADIQEGIASKATPDNFRAIMQEKLVGIEREIAELEGEVKKKIVKPRAEPKKVIKVKKPKMKIVKGKMEKKPEKEPWQMTKKEYASWPGKELPEAYHFNEIVIAIRNGKPVPPEVLVDYPELTESKPKTKLVKQKGVKVKVVKQKLSLNEQCEEYITKAIDKYKGAVCVKLKMAVIIAEALTDANYHKASKRVWGVFDTDEKFAKSVILEKGVELLEDAGRLVAAACNWTGIKIINAFKYYLKENDAPKLADKLDLDELDKEEEPIKEEPKHPEKLTRVEQIPKIVRDFMPIHQQKLLVSIHTEEHWKTFENLEAQIKQLPKLYGTESVKNKIVHLHYFYGGSDWFIIEGGEDDGEYLFFGYAVLNGDTQMSEYGYISRDELVNSAKVELDFFWETKTITEALAEAYPEEFGEKGKNTKKEPEIEPEPTKAELEVTLKGAVALLSLLKGEERAEMQVYVKGLKSLIEIM